MLHQALLASSRGLSRRKTEKALKGLIINNLDKIKAIKPSN